MSFRSLKRNISFLLTTKHKKTTKEFKSTFRENSFERQSDALAANKDIIEKPNWNCSIACYLLFQVEEIIQIAFGNENSAFERIIFVLAERLIRDAGSAELFVGRFGDGEFFNHHIPAFTRPELEHQAVGRVCDLYKVCATFNFHPFDRNRRNCHIAYVFCQSGGYHANRKSKRYKG